jgi:hypothetical protein
MDDEIGMHVWVKVVKLPSGDWRGSGYLQRYGINLKNIDGKTEAEAVSLVLSQMAADVNEWERS